MKTLIIFLSLTFAAVSRAQEARFFRIAGPVPTTITDATADGLVTWTNQATNATFTVQATTALPSGSNWVDWVQVPASNDVTIHRLFDPNPPFGMVLIPAGSFTMGDAMHPNEGWSNELPLHTVYASAFYMDKYEVTKGLWNEVRVWGLNNGYTDLPVGGGKAPNHPVHSVNWYDAVKWCNARSEKEGRTPAYYTNAAQATVYRTGQVNVQNDWVKWNTGYRLPTEAEWEKAARGGASGRRFPWSDSDTIQHSRANYYSSSAYAHYDTSPTRGDHPTFNDGGWPYTSPVGYFAPNGYGLHDMAGNVWEWCWDWYSGTYYSSSPSSDPRGPAEVWARVLRGGSWFDSALGCRAAFRSYSASGGQSSNFGFRSVLPPGQ
jgi:formylglycine-generating enzyme